MRPLALIRNHHYFSRTMNYCIVKRVFFPALQVPA